MKQGKISILAAYGLIVIFNLLANYHGDEQVAGFWKILIIPVLFRYFYSVSWSDPQLKRWIALALLFSWIGDVLLIFDTEFPSFFLFGLGSFLIAHVFYIISSRKAVSDFLSDGRIVPTVLAVLTISAGIGLIYFLYPTLAQLKIPVILYAATIVAMTVAAAWRWGKTTNSSFWLVFLGAAMFMLSDSLIAVNKFSTPIDNASILIMATYSLAQVMIVRGYVLHNLIED